MSQHNAKTQVTPPTTRDSVQTLQTLEQKLDALLAYTQQIEKANAQLTQQLANNEAQQYKLTHEYTQLRRQLDQITTQMQTLEEKALEEKTLEKTLLQGKVSQGKPRHA